LLPTKSWEIFEHPKDKRRRFVQKNWEILSTQRTRGGDLCRRRRRRRRRHDDVDDAEEEDEDEDVV
jgi:hypothetical protein